MLARVKGLLGFPKVHYFGLEGNNAVMVMDLAGNNLSELQRLCDNHFSLKTVLMIADQVLHRLEDLHSRGIVHRAIKPENFVVGIGDQTDLIYAIDLGLANEYFNKATRQHIPRKNNVDFVGTV